MLTEKQRGSKMEPGFSQCHRGIGVSDPLGQVLTTNSDFSGRKETSRSASQGFSNFSNSADIAFSRQLVRTDSWGYPGGLEWDVRIIFLMSFWGCQAHWP